MTKQSTAKLVEGHDQADLRRTYLERGIGETLRSGTNFGVLVVDFINGFTDPSFPTGFNCDSTVLETARLLGAARAGGIPVVLSRIVLDASRHRNSVWLSKMPALSCLSPGSDAVAIDARLGQSPSDFVVTKTAASSFAGTDLSTILMEQRVDTLFICGATTSGCVRASVVDACMGGWRAFVPRECVADRAEGPHLANLFDIQSKYGEVVEVEAIHSMLRTVNRAT